MRTAGWMPRASSRSSAGGLRQLVARLRRAARRPPSGSVVQRRARQPQVQRERDEPLLGAVVEVALEPAPLVVAGLDDARARGAQLLEPGAQLGLQPLVLERERGRRADRARPARGSSASAASWTIAPTGSPSCSTSVDRRAPEPAPGSSTGRPSAST